MKTALIFPGQGSQAPGMGKSLAAAFPDAREVFAEIDDALGQKLSALMFEGPEETLTLTENAQPAIMAVSIAALRVLEKEAGLNVKDAVFVAGHSLGEYSALTAAGSLTLADTAGLLRIRGIAMQQAAPVGVGTMAALLGLDVEAVKSLVEEAAQGEVCCIANDNAPGQIVISGHVGAVNRAIELAKTAGAKRALLLNVSAPFHSPLMQPAAKKMREALAEAGINAPRVPLVANVTAEQVNDPAYIRDLLVEQVTGRVRWRESVHYMKAAGIEKMLELGSGKVLSGLVKRIEPEIVTANVGAPEDIDAFVKAA